MTTIYTLAYLVLGVLSVHIVRRHNSREPIPLPIALIVMVLWPAVLPFVLLSLLWDIKI